MNKKKLAQAPWTSLFYFTSSCAYTNHSPSNLSGVVLGNKSGEGLVTLGVAANEAGDSVGLGRLVELSSGINVGHVDLDTAEVIGGQDAVGPRAVRSSK